MQLSMLFENFKSNVIDKRKQSEIIKDLFKNSEPWREAKQNFITSREKLKSIENTLLQDCPKEQEAIEQLNAEIKNDELVMSDMALNMLLKGEKVEVEDKNGQKYIPELKVKFIKVK